MASRNEQSPDLVELLATDLNSYFPQLMLSYQQRLYTFALRQSGSPQDAEDIVQEAFIRAYHALADYPAERIRMMKLQPWLYKITLHIFYRQKSNSRLQYASLDLSEESNHLEIEDDERVQPEYILEGKEDLRELEEMIARLPEHYRLAVSCYYFDELSYHEIADLLNQPVGTVKSNLHRGKQLLRKTVEAQQGSQARS
ncbi:MAG TPA: sigma-70 family RNA polymerase sigma factor [Ktedonobacteraceae bacterium]|nr:sigma-70 family RNA polymerase sigma factor [Ktedonobacteraceae bacterium]